MAAVLTDVLLMESYVTEKLHSTNIDSMAFIKQSFYKTILAKHKVDSADFYTTFNYYQAHPKEFSALLSLVDSSLSKIEPKDTAFVKPLVVAPNHLEALPNFEEQEKAMQKEYLKNNDTVKSSRKSLRDRIKKNN